MARGIREVQLKPCCTYASIRLSSLCLEQSGAPVSLVVGYVVRNAVSKQPSWMAILVQSG